MNLGPANFSPTYKNFDQLLQTVKNKTVVLILAFKEFLQTSMPPLIFILYAGGCHDFLMKNFCLTVPKNFVWDSNCFWKNSGFENFVDEERGNTFFRRTSSVSQCWKTSWASLQCFKKIGIPKIFMHKKCYHKFPSKNVCCTVPKNFVKEPNSVSLNSGTKKGWG